MTYNVFGGTLNPAQSINHVWLMTTGIEISAAQWIHVAQEAL